MTTKLPPLNKILNDLQYQVMNPIHNVYKNTVPANARMAIKSVLNPSQVTEKNFSPKELNTLKNIYNASQNRQNNSNAKTKQQYLNSLLQQSWNNTRYLPAAPNLNNVANFANSQSDDDIYNMAQELNKKGIQYPDYNTDTSISNIGNNFLVRSVKDPNYVMSTTLGRANTGNNTITDIYDFNKLNGVQLTTPKGNNDSAYLWLRNKLMPKYSNEMPVNINLGNIRR